jgi:hypothetical protein
MLYDMPKVTTLRIEVMGVRNLRGRSSTGYFGARSSKPEIWRIVRKELAWEATGIYSKASIVYTLKYPSYCNVLHKHLDGELGLRFYARVVYYLFGTDASNAVYCSERLLLLISFNIRSVLESRASEPFKTFSISTIRN